MDIPVFKFLILSKSVEKNGKGSINREEKLVGTQTVYQPRTQVLSHSNISFYKFYGGCPHFSVFSAPVYAPIGNILFDLGIS
jgi:hypothetical protein